MRIAILSNVNMDITIKDLSNKYEVFKADGYGGWIQNLVNNDLYSYNPNAIFVILDGEEFFGNINTLKEAENEVEVYSNYIQDAVKDNPNISFFISNFDIPCKRISVLKSNRNEMIFENCWYEKLRTLNDKYNNIYIFDIKNLINNIGRKNFYSDKLWYLGGIKYTLDSQKIIEDEIIKCINALKGYRKKCLILDLDNTLWGGVVGEVGAKNISISDFNEGARYKDFQRRIKELKDTGVILAIASKNNLSDVKDVFYHNSDMVLKEEDFAAIKINWKSKVQNIREISDELNIGLDSFVFIDDNPVEREQVSSFLPEACVPDFPKDTSKLEQFAIGLYSKYFFKLKILNEDLNKTQMYKQNKKRIQLKRSSKSLEEFLKQLNTVIKLWKAKYEDIPRISQLTQKTNQFNLTTKRYTESDIENLMSDNSYDIYVASVQDKFGDNGKVLVIILKINGKNAYVDTFLMSCRVMERNIEFEVMRLIENMLANKGCNMIFSCYNATKKNKPVEGFYEKSGYILTETDDSTKKYKKMLCPNMNDLTVNSFSKLILL